MTTTLATRVRDNAQRIPSRIAMRGKHLGIWHEVSWTSYWDSVLTAAHGLLALGVEPTDRVAIHSDGRCEWLYTDIAAVAIRATTVGLYPTNPAAEVGHILSHSGARILVAEDQEQLDKALAVLDQCPDLTHLIYLDPRGIRGRYDDKRLIYWEDFLAIGQAHRAAHPDAVTELMEKADPEDIATLVYTSGTTGKPKGAMLSVANVEFAIGCLVDGGITGDKPPGPDDRVLSYLPLCHVAERVFTTWYNAAACVQVNFAESIATVQPNLREVQPTILFGVPRIWEKLLATATVKLANASPVKRTYARLWLALAARLGNTLVANGGGHTAVTRMLYGIGWICFFRALRERLGMSRVRFAASAAAPIAPEVLKFFMGIGVPMHELYGMTENAGVATANRPGRVRLGTVGEPHRGTQIEIDPETGEILTRHGAVFAGYFRDPGATSAVKTPDGWLRTGDVGTWVSGTHLKITDRLKDILITAGGKNVAPSEIENALKASPYIKEAIMLGDRKPFLAALIGIELETVSEWAQRHRIAFTTYRDLAEKPEIRELVKSIVDAVNADLASAEQVKEFRMLPKELDHEDGELTATQKVKRSVIISRYADLAADIYGGKR